MEDQPIDTFLTQGQNLFLLFYETLGVVKKSGDPGIFFENFEVRNAAGDTTAKDYRIEEGWEISNTGRNWEYLFLVKEEDF